MRNKQSFKILKHINPEVKVGNIVRLIDGFWLTINKDKHPEFDETLFIVCDYPELGFNGQLRSYTWTVIETGIEDSVCHGVLNFVYLQDIIIECNGVQLRTCSKFVKII